MFKSDLSRKFSGGQDINMVGCWQQQHHTPLTDTG